MPINCRNTCSLILGLIVLAAGSAAADDRTNPPPPLTITIKTELPHLVPPMRRAYVTAGTNKFAFIIPQGFQLSNEAAEGILKFANPSGSAMLTFRVLEALPLEDGRLKPKGCREMLLTLHPQGSLLEELSGNAGGLSGPGFDLAWQTPAGGAQCTRTIFLPFDGRVLEFTATTGPDKFSAIYGALNQLMNTFAASDKQGKLDVALLSDRI